ncbi:hypothetical protein GTY57_21385, partial [Streptomyces sp. SID5475]|nr:hypothetical protein [Streptomyces sp. SID5475]
APAAGLGDGLRGRLLGRGLRLLLRPAALGDLLDERHTLAERAHADGAPLRGVRLLGGGDRRPCLLWLRGLLQLPERYGLLPRCLRRWRRLVRRRCLLPGCRFRRRLPRRSGLCGLCGLRLSGLCG